MSEKLKQDISMGTNLKRLRKHARLSQEQVAASLELMGLSISREVLSQMERGRYNIRVSVLLALKELYHVESFDEFFQDLRLK
ncbi:MULTISPECIES: helix-turn-helix transcriptional regulator [unclassified Oscillibacter]|uniref:helix-turn-helix transcriptional regulator n=1 Tax=unclassified Oscillibacter TaxID=2629304 RepID=UPI002898733B|nr:helix-turn-helix transcriptional regulator [Oscillibacter sp.]